jgi:hypothetical protein
MSRGSSQEYVHRQAYAAPNTTRGLGAHPRQSILPKRREVSLIYYEDYTTATVLARPRSGRCEIGCTVQLGIGLSLHEKNKAVILHKAYKFLKQG